MVNAYITGSRAYGHLYATDESDIDLAVLVSGEDAGFLWTLSGMDQMQKLMYGKINLILFDADNPQEIVRWYKWREAHDYLMAHPPATKEDAIKVFRENGAEKQYRRKADLKDEIKVGDYYMFGTTYGHPDNHGQGLHTNGRDTLFYRKVGSDEWIKADGFTSRRKLEMYLLSLGEA